mmetsp:Transcript_25366/g.64467  ORF Transcript_25366/g.64467 Transcript_25366/m.64467 type:complete len:213 (-) Transcript_25366:376-1014(-)
MFANTHIAIATAPSFPSSHSELTKLIRDSISCVSFTTAAVTTSSSAWISDTSAAICPAAASHCCEVMSAVCRRIANVLNCSAAVPVGSSSSASVGAGGATRLLVMRVRVCIPRTRACTVIAAACCEASRCKSCPMRAANAPSNSEVSINSRSCAAASSPAAWTLTNAPVAMRTISASSDFISPASARTASGLATSCRTHAASESMFCTPAAA